MPFGGAPTIDATDLSLFTYYLGNSRCEPSKANPDERAAILRWFGIAATGQLLAVGPMSLPEYAVVDREQNLRAIADPYGYRSNLNSAAVKESSWGLVKQLYR
jgi:hypothetical protein